MEPDLRQVLAVPGLEQLEPAQRESLARALHQARERQSAALQTAITEALEHVPFLLRGAVRSILLGGKR